MREKKGEKLRVAVTGCGRISALYQEVFHMLQDQVEVVIAIDKRKERAEAFAEPFENCVAGVKPEEIFAKEVDVVHILTPHYLHSEQTIACLNNGIHVLVEKPIAITMESAAEMIKAAEHAKRKLSVICQNRYIEGIVELKKQIRTGALGRLLGVWSSLHWFRPASYYECDWKGKWATEGGGVVMDQAIHSLDLVRYVVGENVIRIDANIARRIRTEIEVEDVADAVITFESGVNYAFYATNYHVANSPIEIEFCFEKGIAKLVGQEMTIRRSEGETTVIKPKAKPLMGKSYWGDYHVSQITEFYRQVREKDTSLLQAWDACKSLEMVLGIYQSAKTESIWNAPSQKGRTR